MLSCWRGRGNGGCRGAGGRYGAGLYDAVQEGCPHSKRWVSEGEVVEDEPDHRRADSKPGK